MPIDPLIPPLAAEKTIRTIWCLKIEATPATLRFTNYREGLTLGGDTYTYRPGVAIGSLSVSPEQLETSCEVTLADADASVAHLTLDGANQKVPVTIKRAWWDGAAFIAEDYHTGKLGSPYSDALVTRFQVIARFGRTGKAAATPWTSVLTAHQVLAPGTTIEVG